MKIRTKFGVRWLRWFNIVAIVLYPFVLFREPKNRVPESLMKHELEHVRQVRRDGWFRFYFRYIVSMFRQKHADRVYEIEAKIAAELPLTPEDRRILGV